MISYVLSNNKYIAKVLLPIFDNYPLLTSKSYNYKLFKEATLILNDNSLDKITKNQYLTDIKSKMYNKSLLKDYLILKNNNIIIYKP